MARSVNIAGEKTPSPDRAEALLPRSADPIPDKSDRVVLGNLVKPWGVRGGQTVVLHNPASELLERVDEVYLAGDGFPARRITVEKARWVGKRYVVHLAGIHTPGDAEALRGLELSVATDALPKLDDDDEFYVRDLIGLDVVDQHGAPLGTLHDVFPTGGNDVYVIQGPQGEVLVPATREHVLEVDLEARRIQVHHEEL
jgi:16S rRNA processing protein RimM